MKYSGDVLSDGQVMAAQCDYDKESFSKLGAHKSPLQSWFEEMEHFTVVEKLECDITIDKPVYIMKLDATVNMYHHFCDFVNLYLTQHLNNSFGLDNNILIWDTFPYRSNFGLTFKAFTKNPIMNLSSFRGKKVCFDDVVFSFLPRMLFGLYYNMPLISGCKSSGLFRAFNRHVLHRLAIKSDSATASGSERIRITLLSRSTQFRKILNEKELISALQNSSTAFDVRRVDFTFSTPFQEQLEIIANTDILIGMHGAGLTHCLFLPDWAVLFELYNCDDANCYKDLASLRGVKYYTWQKSNKVFSQDEGKHPQLGAHKKFTNYAFDKDEFVRIVMTAVEHVRQNRQVTPGGVKDEL
ncbi:EGF domain-specific O-linked N-acetylglucosamine transferase [Halotydeus destructor]|nr:EGF domain-specific O-linked N-acetylglucosamine transferase [Halotydeus destructor]